MCLLGITCAHVNEHLFEGNLPSNRCCIRFLKEFEAGTRFPSRFLKFQLKVGDIRQYPRHLDDGFLFNVDLPRKFTFKSGIRKSAHGRKPGSMKVAGHC